MKPFIDMTNEQTIIAEANDLYESHCETIEEALNEFANNSEYDEIFSVEGNEPENAVRVCQWILWTDSQGNMTANDYNEEHIAQFVMECYSQGLEPSGI